MNKQILKIASFIALFLLIAGIVAAQPFDPPGGGGIPVGTQGAPIDGGISALIAGGAALIARKFYKNRKNKENLSQ